MNKAYKLVTAKAADEHRIFVIGIPDRGEEPPEPGAAKLFELDLSGSAAWQPHGMAFSTLGPAAAVSLTTFVELRPGGEKRVSVAALSEDGECSLRTRDGEEVEGIGESGLHRKGAARYGYLLSLRQIGAHLYACGARGQVYRRTGRGAWAHADEGLLQAKNEVRRLVLHAIEGRAEDDIYVAGDVLSGGFKGRLFHFDGAAWRGVDLPVTKGFNAIHLDEDGHVWLVGADGAIVTGSLSGGFDRVLAEPNPHLFHDATRYRGVLYLASSRGLFRWDEAKKRPARVRTGLPKEIDYASHVDVAGDVLWCAGPRDLARFDGARWTRLPPLFG